MKKSVRLFGFTMAVLCLAALAVAVPNFSGTWILDASKSEMGRGGRGGRGGGTPEITLTINQTGSEMMVTRSMNYNGNERKSEQKFSLDGQENTNPSSMGRGEMVSKATWEGDTLIIEGTQKMQGRNGEMEIPFKEVYSLSDDGKVLTVKTTRTGRQGEMTSTMVYNKQ